MIVRLALVGVLSLIFWGPERPETHWYTVTQSWAHTLGPIVMFVVTPLVLRQHVGKQSTLGQRLGNTLNNTGAGLYQR